MIRPRPFADREAADDWLERVGADREMSGALAAEAAPPRSTAPCTPTAPPPATRTSPTSIPPAPLAIRFGYGTGDEVADGRWRARPGARRGASAAS